MVEVELRVRIGGRSREATEATKGTEASEGSWIVQGRVSLREYVRGSLANNTVCFASKYSPFQEWHILLADKLRLRYLTLAGTCPLSI